jgi:hypothetical protein
MKVSKGKSQKISTKENPLHIHFDVLQKHTLSELPTPLLNAAHGKIGSIRMLMAVHNGLVDSVKGQTEANQRAIMQACAVLETNVDQKIDAFNDFLAGAFGKSETKRTAKRKNEKRRKKATRSKLVKKTRKTNVKK